ncbi:hypothetical protein BGX27_000209 [Mortierella sp. AM989]|nr:hypothetical protein BGX27_000209 [Mortierella sp. AM989]
MISKLDHSQRRQSTSAAIVGAARQSRVLIAGGSFGALFLALLLERQGVPYFIFDGGARIHHLGAALALGPSILPVFEQLGVTNLLASISLPCPTLEIYNHKLKKLGSIIMKDQSERTGYDNLICSRSNLYDLLFSQLNPVNVVSGKKILWYEENELGVNLCCSDNSIYSGDILVGADGVHSRVRKTMHKILAKKNMLSRSDKEIVRPEYALVTGVTHRQSAERYQCLKDPFVHFCSVVGVHGRGWNAINIPDDQICWSLWVQLDSTTDAQVEDTENSEYGGENTEPIVKLFRDMPCPYGGTMGDLVDSTNDELKSKVYVEEKMFQTWYHGRTVLLGDGEYPSLPKEVVICSSYRWRV